MSFTAFINLSLLWIKLCFAFSSDSLSNIGTSFCLYKYNKKPDGNAGLDVSQRCLLATFKSIIEYLHISYIFLYRVYMIYGLKTVYLFYTFINNMNPTSIITPEFISTDTLIDLLLMQHLS